MGAPPFYRDAPLDVLGRGLEGRFLDRLLLLEIRAAHHEQRDEDAGERDGRSGDERGLEAVRERDCNFSARRDRVARRRRRDRGQRGNAERAVIPIASTGFTPTRVTSCAASPDQKIAVPATARYATPVFIAEYPSTCCM